MEHVSASRQDPNGVFLARAPVCSEFLFFRNLNKDAEYNLGVLDTPEDESIALVAALAALSKSHLAPPNCVKNSLKMLIYYV